DPVGDGQTRGKVDAVLDVSIEIGIADAGREDLARLETQEARIARLVDSLRVDDIQAQAIVDRELRIDAPRVLPVVEVPPLALARIGAGAIVTAEVRHITKQERCQAQAATSWAACAVIAKGQFAGAVNITRHAQVVSATHIHAELEGVVAEELGRVADKLELVLILIERTVETVDNKT